MGEPITFDANFAEDDDYIGTISLSWEQLLNSLVREDLELLKDEITKRLRNG